MNPTKAHISAVRRAHPKDAGAVFRFVDTIPAAKPDKGAKRAGDPGDMPQAMLDRRALVEAEVLAERAAREARDEALLAGEIEFIGMGRFRVLT